MISSKLQALFAVLTGAIVLTAVVWGFVILGSPFTERLRKFDERRVEDLRDIRDAIERMVVDKDLIGDEITVALGENNREIRTHEAHVEKAND